MTRLLRAAEQADMPAALADTLKPKSMAEEFVVTTLKNELTDYGIALLLNMIERSAVRVAAAEDEVRDGG